MKRIIILFTDVEYKKHGSFYRRFAKFDLWNAITVIHSGSSFQKAKKESMENVV